MSVDQSSQRMLLNQVAANVNSNSEYGSREDGQVKIKPFKCEYCTKRFSTNGNLTVHVRTHTGEKPYKCKYCVKQFSTSGNLNSHIRVHTDEKPFECYQCGKKFSHKSNLNVHVRSHTGVKPYICDFCGKQFVHSNVLSVHMRIHNVSMYIKPEKQQGQSSFKGYQANVKSEDVDDYENLEDDLKTVTSEMDMPDEIEEEPYLCEYCNLEFQETKDFVNHMRTHVRE